MLNPFNASSLINLRYQSYVIIFLTALICGCTVFHENRLQLQTKINHFRTEVIPFSYVKKLIVVEATANSQTRRKFIFDTGAFQSKIEYRLSEQLKLKKEYSRVNGTAQGISKRIHITSIDSIKLSSATYYEVGAGILHYSPDSYSQCVAESGIIGSNLIKLSNWKIDYKNQLLTLSEKPIHPRKSAKTIPIKFKTTYLSGVPLIDLNFEGQVIKDVIIDLGYNGGIMVPKKYASAFPLSETEKVVDQSTAGIFGSNRDDIDIKYLNLNLGDRTIRIPVKFSTRDKALIGNDFLEHFTIYLDYQNEVINFEVVSKVEIDQSKAFIPGILNDTLWIVDRVNSHIPLSVGDTLQSVDGYQPKDIFESNCDYFMNISKLIDKDSLVVKSLDSKVSVIKMF